MPHVLQRHPPVLFAHVPKTGGMWARSTLGLEKLYGAHGPHHEVAYMLPHVSLGTPVCVTQIRDPWSWYCSLYLHLVAMGREEALAEWGDGSADFADVLRGWTSLDGEVGPLVIYAPYGPGPHPEPCGGLWSWTYALYLRDLPVQMIDLAQVAEGWSQLLDEPPDDAPPANVRGSEERYRDLYTADLQALVAAADEDLISHCGYTFLGAASAPLTPWSTGA